MSDLRLILIVSILSVFSFILGFIIASVIRRLRNERRYSAIDQLRDRFRTKLAEIDSITAIDRFSVTQWQSAVRVGSVEWIALEDVIFEFAERKGQKAFARRLFTALGYTKYYQGRLSQRSPIDLSVAADKLGRIGDPSSLEPLSKLLDHPKSEVSTVAFRALCRLGKRDALQRLLNALPKLMKNQNVSSKTIQTSLLLFEPWASATLIEFAGKTGDPKILALLIETLIGFPAHKEMYDLAINLVSHSDPEVRGKALRLLAREENVSFSCDPSILQPLLSDPIWFVRLQAAKTIGRIKCGNFMEMLKKFALDEKWQVRDSAAFALSELGEASIDVFLELMETPDRYAKESICEEIQRSGYVLGLIGYLEDRESDRKDKAKRILQLMHQLGFSSPLRDAVEAESTSPHVRNEISSILNTGGAQ
ncbi:MAG: HEAT repeat domain-containing protein [Syntrophaceae bacterium]|nr:HEAT repeat domain-containing protein [Syntrophaceae bacterium]